MGHSENLDTLRRWKAQERPTAAPEDIFVPGCTGKVRHPTKAAAITATKIIRGTRIYVCRNCSGWHTASE